MLLSEMFASNQLFRGIDADASAALLAASSIVTLSGGELVIRAGAPADAMYIVLEGELHIVVEENGKLRQIDAIKPGEAVGEHTAVHGRAQVATALAAGPARVLRIPVDALDQLFARDPLAKERSLEAVARHQPSSHLSVNPLFADLNPEELKHLDEHAHPIRLRSGEILCKQGDEADSMFIVASGSLEIVVESAAAGEWTVDVIGRGASVGEMAVLNDEPRSATVRAIRDSELIRIPAAEFRSLLARHASIALHLARTLSDRLRRTTVRPRFTRTTRAITIIPAGENNVPSEFVRDLSAALSQSPGDVRCIDRTEIEDELGAGMADIGFDQPENSVLLEWLSIQEAGHRFRICVCDAVPSAWTGRALREADLILCVGTGASPPELGPVERTLDAACAPHIRRELVLLHSPGSTPHDTERWLRNRKVSHHHHVRLRRQADYGRLARWISGTSLGVALSGGGARGFAHIGVLQSLADRGLAADLVGGTSMGSVIAAQAALGWDTPTMIERNRIGFLRVAVVRDFTFPYISLMRGRSTVKLLRWMFGETQIEDLWLPYFCLSTNLSRAEIVVHDRGPLWLWTRASSSVPGIGPPVVSGGDLLVDGGVLNNLPADVMRQRCPGTVVAVNATPAVELLTSIENRWEMSGWPHLWRSLNPWSRSPQFPNILEIAMRSATLSSADKSDHLQTDADLYLRPPVDSIKTLDWGAIDRAVEIGYNYACEAIDAWRRAE